MSGTSACPYVAHDIVSIYHLPLLEATPKRDFWVVWQMQSYAILHNLMPFISMQNHYNLLYREEEREMMPTLKVRPHLHVYPI
jgi:hypothetical protein